MMAQAGEMIKATAASKESLTTFQLFPKLPVELQLMIWGVAIHTVTPPRVIKPLISSKNPKVIYTTAKVPALLHTCATARAVALKSYTLTFARWRLPDERPIPPRIYFDFARDFLYQATRCICLAETYAHPLLDPTDGDRVERLAMERHHDPSWAYIEISNEVVKELMLIELDQVMTGGWAWEKDFETVDENTHVDASETGKQKTLMEEREEEKMEYKNENPNSMVTWTIERAWGARYVIDLTEE